MPSPIAMHGQAVTGFGGITPPFQDLGSPVALAISLLLLLLVAALWGLRERRQQPFAYRWRLPLGRAAMLVPQRARSLAAAGLLLALSSPTPAAGCIGDCNADLDVTVDEILSGVNIALGRAQLGGCTASDGDRSGSVTVDEILLAVQHALNGCQTREAPPPEPEAVEQGVGVSQSTLAIIDIGSPANPPSDSQRAARNALGKARGAAGSNAIADCSLGGRAEVECAGSGGQTVRRISYFECRSFGEEGKVQTIDGESLLVLERGDLCDTGGIPPATNFTFTARALSTTIESTDGSLVERSVANLTEEFIARRPAGCSGRDGTSMLDGSLSVLRQSEGIDASYQYEGFVTDTDSGGSPCDVSTQLNGRVAINDRANFRRFSQTARGFESRERREVLEGIPLRSVDLTGTLDTDCIGELRVESVAPQEIPIGATCPIAGLDRLEIAGSTSFVRHTADGGIEIFLGSRTPGPGATPDRVFSSCRAAALEQCFEPILFEGDLLVTNPSRSRDSIVIVDPVNGEQAELVSVGLSSPAGIAIEDDGNLVVADGTRIVRIDPRTEEQRIVSEGDLLRSPTSIAVHPNGDLLVFDVGIFDGAVVAVDPHTGTQRIYATNLGSLSEVEVDSAGIVYFSPFRSLGTIDPVGREASVRRLNGRLDSARLALLDDGGIIAAGTLISAGGRGEIRVIRGSQQTTLAEGAPFSRLRDVEVDGEGIVFVIAEAGIVRFHPDTGARVTLSPGGLLRSPFAMAIVPAPKPVRSLRVRPFEIEFEEVRLQTTEVASVAVQNNGSRFVEVGESFVTGRDAGEFAVVADRCAGIILEAGASCHVDVEFSPARVGVRRTTLVVSVESTGLEPIEVGIAGRTEVRSTILVADPAADAVFRVDPDTGEQAQVSPPSRSNQFESPTGLAVEADGSILVADSGARTIFRVNPRTGAQIPLSSGDMLRSPEAVTVDAQGRILVADGGAVEGSIIEIDPRTGRQSVFASNLGSGLHDIDIDLDGRVLVSPFRTLLFVDSVTRQISSTGLGGRISNAWMSVATDGAIYLAATQFSSGGRGELRVIDGGSNRVLTGGFEGTRDVEVDANGEVLFIASGVITRLDPATGARRVVTGGRLLRSPWGMALD